MKALSSIAVFFAAFLIVLGAASREKNGDVLGYATMIGGALILIFVALIWAMALIKRKKEREDDSDEFDS